jgi:hypothetical protein
VESSAAVAANHLEHVLSGSQRINQRGQSITVGVGGRRPTGKRSQVPWVRESRMILALQVELVEGEIGQGHVRRPAAKQLA